MSKNVCLSTSLLPSPSERFNTGLIKHVSNKLDPKNPKVFELWILPASGLQWVSPQKS